MITIGTFVGNRYEIVEKVGTGGMADVYRAKDHRLNRFVAVKVLKNEYSEDTRFVTKFRQEAQSVASISHPNIVGVYDVGEEEEAYYIVMEFVDGITLKNYIEKKGVLPVREAVGIGLQIASGLEAAHSNNIIHRDIKPQNILIARDGTAKISDFGIAKAASSNTITASAMGSVHYISPEQAKGGYSDEKSDIYSLGVSMYEMLSGKLPFTGEKAVAVALAHVQEEAIPLNDLDGTIPVGISNIVNKCMQKKPDMRYADAAELITEMKMFLQKPDGEYGVIKSLYENQETIFISNGDMDKIKDATKVRIPVNNINEENAENDENEGEVDPRLEKALIIGSIVVAVIIGIIIIVMLGNFIGLWGGSSLPEATATPSVSDGSNPSAATQTPVTVGEQVTIPDITNMTKDKAIIELENNSLKYKFTEQESDDVEAGKVIGTNPAVGSTVDKNSQVEVYVCTGAKKVSLPSVAGYSEAEARNTLESAGFTVKSGSEVYSDSVAEGLVAYTDPKGGAKVLPGSKVTLYFSKGPEQTTAGVPDLIGMTKKQAKSNLEAKGLVLGKVSTAYSDSVEKNKVCAQSKVEGTEVKKGTAIDITISLGEKKTYSYYGNITISDNPFEYETDPISSIKFVLSQDGTTKTIKTVELSYSDFPYTITNIKGSSASSGTIIVYKDGDKYGEYEIDFKKVAN